MELGDGTADSIPYPSHTYANAGYYTICLYIQDSTGCTDSICHSYQLQKMSSAEAENTIYCKIIPDIPSTIQIHRVTIMVSISESCQGTAFINYILIVPAKVSIDYMMFWEIRCTGW
jgi:PKD repeat protein